MDLQTTLSPEHTLLNQVEAARILGVKPQTLAVWRCTKRYELPFVRIAGRMIRYRLSDVLAFASANTPEQP